MDQFFEGMRFLAVMVLLMPVLIVVGILLEFGAVCGFLLLANVLGFAP